MQKGISHCTGLSKLLIHGELHRISEGNDHHHPNDVQAVRASFMVMIFYAISDELIVRLVRLQAEAEVVEAACIIEMPDLKGRSKLGDVALYCQIEKEGD